MEKEEGEEETMEEESEKGRGDGNVMEYVDKVKT